MVKYGETLQQISRREEELQEEKQRLKIVLREKLPERKYGVPIRRVQERQRQILRQRREIPKKLKRISERERELFKLRGQVKEAQRYEQAEREIKLVTEKAFRKYERTRRFPTGTLSQRIKKIYQYYDIKGGEKAARLLLKEITKKPRLEAEEKYLALKEEGFSKKEIQGILRKGPTIEQFKELEPKTKKLLYGTKKPETITITEIPAQELGGVRVIDTKAGPIIVRGKAAWEEPTERVIAETLGLPSERRIDFQKEIREAVKKREVIEAGRLLAIETGLRLGVLRRREVAVSEEERKLEKKQIEDIERVTSRIEEVTVDKEKGKYIIEDEKIAADIEKEISIIESRQARLGVLEERRKELTTPKYEKAKRFEKTIIGKFVLAPMKFLKDYEKAVKNVAETVWTPERTETFAVFERRLAKIAKREAREPTPAEMKEFTRVVGGYGIYAVPVAGEIAFVGTAERGFMTLITPTKRIDERLLGGVELGVAGGIVGRQIYRRAKIKYEEPLRVKLPSLKKQTEALSKIYTIKQLEKSINIGRFEIATYVPPQKYFQLKKGELWFAKVKPEKLKVITEKELKTLFPKGEVITTEPALVYARTTPFVIRKGRIDTAYLTVVKATQKRIEPVKIYKLEGGVDISEKQLRLVDYSKLDVTTRRALEEATIVKDFSKKLEAIYKGTKKTAFQRGDIKVTELFKIGKIRKGEMKVTFKPRGRRIERGELAIISETKMLQQFEREFGLKEIELIGERIGYVRTTKPPTIRFRKAPGIFKKVGVEKELTEILRETKFVRPWRRPRLKTFEELPKPIREFMRETSKGFFIPKTKIIRRKGMKPFKLKKGDIYVDIESGLAPSKIREVAIHELGHRFDIYAAEKPITKQLEKFLTRKQLKKARIKMEKEYPELKELKILKEQYFKEYFARKFAERGIGKRIVKTAEEPIIEVKPRKAEIIRGRTIRYEYELPPIREPTLMRRGVRRKLTPEQVQLRKLDLQQTQKAIANLVAKTSRIGVPTPKLAKPKVRERIIQRRALKPISIQAVRVIPTTKTFFKETQIPRVTARVIPREITREVAKTITRTTPKEITKYMPKEITKVTQKQLPRQLTRQLTRQVTKIPSQPPPKVTIRIKTPRIPEIARAPIIPFKLPAGATRISKKRKKKYRENIALVQSFTAKALKLKPLKIPITKLKVAIPKYQTIGIRRLPVITLKGIAKSPKIKKRKKK